MRKVRDAKRYLKHTIKRWKNYVLPDPIVFDSNSLQRREEFKADYEILASSLSEHIDFETVLDIGCAQGLLMKPLLRKGYSVRGVEVSEDVVEFLPKKIQKRVVLGDFEKATGDYDLVCCVEVAEHIDPNRSTELVEKICDLSNRHIYFTAAPPTQGGHGHINCRPHSHWINWIESYDWELKKCTTKKIRRDLNKVEKTEWLAENSFVFSKNDK